MKTPFSLWSLEPTEAMCAPWATMPWYFSKTMHESPSCVHLAAVASPDMPPPTMTTSAISVSEISDSGMGGGGVVPRMPDAIYFGY
jgi:hypothetical protein